MMRMIRLMRTPPSSISFEHLGANPKLKTVKMMASNSGVYFGSKGQLMKTALLKGGSVGMCQCQEIEKGPNCLIPQFRENSLQLFSLALRRRLHGVTHGCREHGRIDGSLKHGRHDRHAVVVVHSPCVPRRLFVAVDRSFLFR